MPQQIFIQQNDQYNVAGDTLFQIQIGNKIFRDIPVDLNKIDRYSLIELLRHAGVTGISKLKKAELLQLYTQWYVIIQLFNN